MESREISNVIWMMKTISPWLYSVILNENEVELMIVNVLNHSMIVLKGLKGEELNEMDLSELVENEIVDLNEDGRRWEGEVLKGMQRIVTTWYAITNNAKIHPSHLPVSYNNITHCTQLKQISNKVILTELKARTFIVSALMAIDPDFQLGRFDITTLLIF